MSNNNYYKNILGQILQGEQPKIKNIIDIYFEDGYELEGQIYYNFEDLAINKAIQFLQENWKQLELFLI